MSTNIQNPAIETLLSLTRIDPNLNIVDPQYTSNLNGYLRALQSNIDQILSIPFLQGRQGDSVLIGEFDIFTKMSIGPTVIYTEAPTEIGWELITALFPKAHWEAPDNYPTTAEHTGTFEEFLEWYNNQSDIKWADIIDAIPEYAPVYEVTSWENLCPKIEHGGEIVYDYSKKVQLYYTVDYNTNDKKILGSSRYFVYYDPRLAQISGGLDADEVFRDVSAALFRESYEENNETLWHFVNKGILPTIYWSAENGYWCWSINEIDTGIRCEGIKGEDGKDGNARVVRVSTDSTTSENSGDFRGMATCIINSVFDQTNGWVSNDIGTLLEDNMVVFAIIDDVLPEDSEDPENEDPTLNPNLAFGVVFREADDSTWKCYAYTNTSLADLIRDVTLPGLLDTINKYSNSLKGLYVKDYSAYSSSSNVCHALYSDTSNTLKIAPVNWSDFKNGTVTTVDSTDSTLSLNYSTLSVPSSMTLTNSSSSSLTTINCSNLKIASGSQALTINSTSILMSSGDITISGATTINGFSTEFNSNYISFNRPSTAVLSGFVTDINFTNRYISISNNGNFELDANMSLISTAIPDSGKIIKIEYNKIQGENAEENTIIGIIDISNNYKYNSDPQILYNNIIQTYGLKINASSNGKGIYCNGQCDIIGNTTISKTINTAQGNGNSLILNHTETITSNAPYPQPKGVFTINNVVNASSSNTNKIYALKINNDGNQKYGIHCTGQCDIIGATNIIGTTTIKNASNVYGGQLEIDDDGIALTGTTTIKNTLFLQFNEPTQTYLVTRESDGTLKAIPQTS